MPTHSSLVKRAIGTYIPDTSTQLPPVNHWLTQECRHGILASIVKLFCAGQPEAICADDVLVESLDGNTIKCRAPFAAYDHESPHAYMHEVAFEINPETREITRLTDGV